MKKTALITGASAGIGAACAKTLAKEGYRLILAARRADRLQSLADELQHDYQTQIHQIVLDVRDRRAVENVISELPTEWRNIDVLINNAGLSQGLDPIQTGDLDDWDRMIDTNIKGLLYVTRAVLPDMQQRNSG